MFDRMRADAYERASGIDREPFVVFREACKEKGEHYEEEEYTIMYSGNGNGDDLGRLCRRNNAG